MNKFLRYIPSIILSFLTTFSFAQNTRTVITGRVLDSETRDSEAGAVVIIHRDGDNLAYSVTDTTGAFSLNTYASGPLTLRIENMGRKTIEQELAAAGGTIDLGEILMESDAEVLKESSVSALRTLVKIDADRLSYDVEHDIDAKSMTALDLLRKVPMVTVDAQDNITVNGSSSFKVYVDGRPNQMLSNSPSQMFKVMPASSIKSIEVVTNPGAKYDAEGTGGILDIKTMGGSAGAMVKDGIYGTVNGGIDTRGRYDGGISLNAQKGKWSFGANIHGMHEKMDGVESSSLMEYLSTSTRINSLTTGTVNKGSGMFSNLTVGFEPDTLNLFNLSVGMNRFSRKNSGGEGRTTYTVSGVEMPELGYTQQVDGDMSMAFVNASFDYQHSFAGNRDRTLTLSYQYSGNPSKNNNTYKIKHYDGLEEERVSLMDDITSEHTFQTDFTTPIGKGQTLSSGLKYIFRHNSADDAYNGTPSVYDYYNHIGAAYAEYSATIDKLVMTAGLRYEHTFQKVDYDLADKNFDINYGNLVPNASLQWNISQTGNLSLAYNMRIRRPGIRSLNPYVDRSDPTSVYYGNPDIQAEKNHRISLAYNLATPKVVLSMKLRERIGKGGISEYSFYKDGVLNTTYGNIVNHSSTGLDVYANWNINNKTRLYMNGDLDYNIYHGDMLDQHNAGWDSGIFAGFQTSIFWDMRLSLNTFIHGGDITLQGHSDPFQFGMMGLTKTFFNDKLSVTVQGATPLFSRRLTIHEYSVGKDFSNETIVKIPVQSVGFNISYTFGEMRSGGKKVRRGINNDDIEQNTSDGSIIPGGTGGAMGM
ncbi:MAG: TonB-dependent receptor [Bacteroidales bacterium]|nr:TonB-dependent receptor [Bacteroidales bacterium]